MDVLKTKGIARMQARDLVDILMRICGTRHLDPVDVMGRGRTQRLVKARQDLMYELRERGLSLPEIGRLTDRHHTTVLHHLQMREVHARKKAAA